jgi:hypothetical protein
MNDLRENKKLRQRVKSKIHKMGLDIFNSDSDSESNSEIFYQVMSKNCLNSSDSSDDVKSSKNKVKSGILAKAGD